MRVSVVSGFRPRLNGELLQESGPNRVRRSPSLAGKRRLWNPGIHHHVRRHRQDNLALCLPNMLLQSTARRSQLASQLIRRRPFRNLVVSSLYRRKNAFICFSVKFPNRLLSDNRKASSVMPSADPLCNTSVFPTLSRPFSRPLTSLSSKPTRRWYSHPPKNTGGGIWRKLFARTIEPTEVPCPTPQMQVRTTI